MNSRQKQLWRMGCVSLAAVALLTACGNELFEHFMFSPATQLPKKEQPCDRIPLMYPCKELNPQEVFFDSADARTRLQSIYLDNPLSDRLIIYFHGNGSNIYFRMRFAAPLVKIANVLILSYRGYGKSSGRPTESGLYEDAQATINHAIHTLGFEESKIYIYGRSLGGAVAIYSAQNRAFAGLILISTFSSGYDLAFDRGMEGFLGSAQPFNSIGRLKNVHIPILFVHGDQDQLVPIEHSLRLYESYRNHDKDLQVLEGANHWNIHRVGGQTLWKMLDAFVNTRKQDTKNDNDVTLRERTTNNALM